MLYSLSYRRAASLQGVDGAVSSSAEASRLRADRAAKLTQELAADT
jgi:hypothetical protein